MVNLREVARITGCSAPNIYNYFESLDDLLNTALIRICEDYTQKLQTEIQNHKQPKEILLGAFKAYIEYAVEYPGRLNFFHFESLNIAVTDETDAMAEGVGNQMAGLMGFGTGNNMTEEKMIEITNILHKYLLGELSEHITGRKKIENEENTVNNLVLYCKKLFAIFMEDGGAPYDFTSLRGEEIEIYGGNGMYAYNTTEYALMMRAYDWCYLVLAIPIMLIGLILYRKKSIIGCFILLSSLFFFFYSFFINSIAVAYNNYFLIYIAVFVASIFAMILMINDISFEHIRNKIMPRLPIKTMTVITLILVSYFFISWMIIDFSSLFQGVVHPDVSIYTTAGFNIVDLSIFVTLSITGIILLFKRKPLGTILVLMLILMAPLTLIALSIYLVMNVHFQQLSILSIEFPLMIFAVVVLGIDIFTISKIKGIKL